MKFLKTRLLLVAVVGFASMGTAHAQTTQNINVSATVPSVCVVDVATTETAMAFDLSGLATATGPFDATTTLAWRCSSGYTTAISIGKGSGPDVENRAMYDGITPLAYNLYTDNTHTVVWGDGTGASQTVGITGLGMGTVGNSVVYGRIQLAAAQAAPIGTYTDTVLVTILP